MMHLLDEKLHTVFRQAMGLPQAQELTQEKMDLDFLTCDEPMTGYSKDKPAIEIQLMLLKTNMR